MTATSIEEKLSRITEHWRPKVVAELNGQEVKLVKFQGEFPWHHHINEDELFLVWRGQMHVEFRDRIVVLHLPFHSHQQSPFAVSEDLLDSGAQSSQANLLLPGKNNLPESSNRRVAVPGGGLPRSA